MENNWTCFHCESKELRFNPGTLVFAPYCKEGENFLPAVFSRRDHFCCVKKQPVLVIGDESFGHA